MVEAHARINQPRYGLCIVAKFLKSSFLQMRRSKNIMTSDNVSQKRKKCKLELKQKAEDFIKDKRNSNNLIDILLKMESDDDGEILAALQSVKMIFKHAVENGYLDNTETCSEINTESAEEKYRHWLNERYIEVKNKMTDLFQSPNRIIKELSLCSLMKLLSVECKRQNHLLMLKKMKKMKFPIQFFELIFSKLISSEYDNQFLCSRFHDFLQCDDIRFFTLKYLQSSMKQKKKKEILNEVYINNLLYILQGITLASTDKDSNNFHQSEEKSDPEQKQLLIEDTKKLFNSVWMDFLSFKLNNAQYKKVLVSLHDRVLPHLFNPLLLTDFLVDSYNIGGAVSLLALNSLFILIQKYNLEYPEFYKKLYSLLDPGVFHVKYKSRFFYLADLFLSSTHLPEYLVAAFIKKVARLALSAPSSCLMFVIPFIGNLIVRHPNLFKLLHKPGITDFQNDPFLEDEPDPLKTYAVDSCLWELKILSESHYLYGVALKARFVDQPLHKTEEDIHEVLETSVSEMIEKETKKKIKIIPLTYEKPDGLMKCSWDKMDLFWKCSDVCLQ